MFQHPDALPLRTTPETAAGEPIDLVAVIGAVDDAAWSGTGDATVISLLKAIALNTTAP
jgi:hypothetical protein